MGKTNSPLLQISSGNLYGFRFVNNNFDRGYSSILHSEADAKNWIISGNTFSGIMGYGNTDIFMGIDGNVEQVTISNNTFTQVEMSTLTSRIFNIGGNVNGLELVNNTFSEIKNVILGVFAENVKNSIFSNNILIKNAYNILIKPLCNKENTSDIYNTDFITEKFFNAIFKDTYLNTNSSNIGPTIPIYKNNKILLISIFVFI